MTTWKPGDRALVLCSDGAYREAVYSEPELGVWSEHHWRFDDGMFRSAGPGRSKAVVALDPDDIKSREVIECWFRVSLDDKSWAQIVRRWVRPGPPEPTGLGAVVKVASGELYVRDKTTTTVHHWKRARGEDGSRRYSWNALNVTEVLSEGVA